MKRRLSLYLGLFAVIVLATLSFTGKFSGLFQADVLNQSQSFIQSSTLADIPVLDTEIKLDTAKNEHYFTSKTYGLTTETGYPVLPYYDFEILIAPDSDEKSVLASLIDQKTTDVEGEYSIKPGPKVEAMAKDTLKTEDIKPSTLREKADIYDENKFYPEQNIQVTNVGEARKWKIAKVRYYPYTYNPVTKKLKLTSSSKVEVAFKYPQKVVAMSSTDRVMDSEVKATVDNYGDALKFYDTSIKSSSDNPAPLGSNYTIITTNAIQSASTKLSSFVAEKRNRGFTVTVATESQWGGGTGDTAANNIRNYLKNNYASQSIKYVLLIGNPNPGIGDVPMKMTYPTERGFSEQLNPTDFYYADLSSNWDINGNGKSGETSDLAGIDGNAEVYVGRIPYYGVISDTDSILQKDINYETGVLGYDWIKKAMLTMANSDPGNANLLGEQIKNEITVPAGFVTTRLYDQTVSPPPDVTPLSKAEIINRWNTHQGFHLWAGHGNSYAFYTKNGESFYERFSSSDTGSLNNNYPSFTFQSSCSNGDPMDPNNLAYSLLKNGAIATISASNTSYYYPTITDFSATDSSEGLEYRYAKKMILEKKTAGEALYQTMSELPVDLWSNHSVFNLYGDPALTYAVQDLTAPVMQSVNDEGKYSARSNALYISWSASDPESAVVEYQYKITEDAVDGTVIKDWTSASDSPDVLAASLTMTEGKTYYVGVKARNVSNLWSDPKYSDGIIYDLAPPAVPSLTSKSFTYKGSLAIGGAKTSNTKKVLLDGNEVSVDDGANIWSSSIDLPNIGKRTISLVGQNDKGNQTDPVSIDLFRYKTADANNDNIVNSRDFSALMFNWNKTGSANPADFNEDDKVNSTDFSMMMLNWGK